MLVDYLLDTHYHLDFIQDDSVREQFLKKLPQENIQIVAQTILPSTFDSLYQESLALKAKSYMAPFLSLGFHPWWIKSYQQADFELEIFQDKVKKTRFIGEIGLDYYPGRLSQANEKIQKYVFENLLKFVRSQAIESTKPYILSIHTVRSATDVIDIIEELGLVENNVVPIFHHFNGQGDELVRLRDLGCYLSVHPRMLSVKKGRSYIQQMPADRLLLETDLPTEKVTAQGKEQSHVLAKDLKSTLDKTLVELKVLKGDEVVEEIIRSQERLYLTNLGRPLDSEG